MNALESAMASVARTLDRLQVRYMVIGGFAATIWGEPRLTQDLDVTVDCAPDDVDCIWRLTEAFVPRTSEPARFVRETHVLPVQTADGVRLDLVFAGLPYERNAIARAVAVPAGGYPVRICTPEDLIILKIISPRPRDKEDVRGVIRRQSGHLDRAYLDPIVAELAEVLAQPEIEEFYRSLWEP